MLFWLGGTNEERRMLGVTNPRVAGLDLSLTSTGFVVLDAVTGETVDQKAIKPKGGGRERFPWLRDVILGLLDSVQPVAKVAVEGYAYGMRGQAVYQLAGLGEIVRLTLAENGFDVVEVPPASLKQFVTGKGNAKKEHMILEVYKRWGVECKTSDEADAYGLAQMARALLNDDVKLTAFQTQALGKVASL